MTGPEHYREAEHALRAASTCDPDYGGEGERYHLARAQVHATLALTAATATQPARWSSVRPEWTEWAEVVSAEHARPSRVRLNGEGSAR